MSAPWPDDDDELKVGVVKRGLRSKPRFSLNEIRLLLEAVMRNRYIILRRFNHGVSSEIKKQTWAEITAQINGLGENHREVRQIMKKWADLKCDGKRRLSLLRGPNGSRLRKKNLGLVERMVHKILMLSPRGDGDSDVEPGEDNDFSKLLSKGLPPSPSPYSYLSLTENSLQGGTSFEISPLSSPEKEHGDYFNSSSEFDVDLGDDGERTMDCDEDDDSLLSSLPSSLDPLPADIRPRVKPVYTYSRTSTQNQNHIQNHNYSRPTSGPSSSASAPSHRAPPATSNDSTCSSTAPLSCVPSATSHQPPSSTSTQRPTPGSNLPDSLPAGASSLRSRDQMSQMASQSLQQQRTSRMLLSSVSRSLEALAQSVQLLVETQQDFVQESLLLQRQTVDILRDFSNTALTILRDKATSGHVAGQHHPPAHF